MGFWEYEDNYTPGIYTEGYIAFDLCLFVCRYIHPSVRKLTFVFLAHLARRAIFSSPGPKGNGELLPYQCAWHESSVTLENKYSNIFYKTTVPTVLKFNMEHDLTPGSQNCKIRSGWISKMATVTKNSKNNKISFFSRITGYVWLNFGMEYQWNIGIQNCKNEKNL